MQLIDTIFPEIDIPKKVVITTHQKPDGDAMGSSLALYHFLNKFGHIVHVISPTNWASFLSWMPGVEEVINYETQIGKSIICIQDADWIFCLDFNVLNRTKNLEISLQEATATKILIDHHENPATNEFDFGISNSKKSSTCEMVFDFIIASGNEKKLDKKIATCLYTGVMTDTGSFRFPSTTASVHKMIAKLKDVGLEHSVIHDNIYDNSLENRLRFMGNAFMYRMEVLYQYNTALMYIPKSDVKKFELKTGDTEGLVNHLLSIKGIKLAAIVIDREEERKWSFRSKGQFDVNTFARRHFAGGGHVNAAGGSSTRSLDDTVNYFYEVLKGYKEELE